MNTKENAERDSVESAALLGLLVDIRARMEDLPLIINNEHLTTDLIAEFN